MTELERLLAALEQPRARPAVVATLVRVAGSAYRGPGARLLVLPDGTTVGAVSGGCLEKDLVAHAEQVRETHAARLVHYDLMADDTAWGLNLGCRARLDVLLEPVPPGEIPAHLSFVAEAAKRRQSAVVATVFQAPEGAAALGERLCAAADGERGGGVEDGELAARLLADSRRVLLEERADVVEHRLERGAAAALLEFFAPPLAVAACGDGPDTTALAHLAAVLGWEARVVGKDQPLGELDQRTAAVVMTHNYARDLELLGQLLPSRARYVAVLGPRARTKQLLADLALSGKAPDQAQLLRLHGPAGLDIGAETPEEVALAVLAEIRTVFSGRTGGPLKEREGPIHDRR